MVSSGNEFKNHLNYYKRTVATLAVLWSSVAPAVRGPVQLPAVPQHGVVRGDGQLPPEAHLPEDGHGAERGGAVARAVAVLPAGAALPRGPAHTHALRQVHHPQRVLLHLPPPPQPLLAGLQRGQEEHHGPRAGDDRLPAHPLDPRSEVVVLC